MTAPSDATRFLRASQNGQVSKGTRLQNHTTRSHSEPGSGSPILPMRLFCRYRIFRSRHTLSNNSILGTGPQRQSVSAPQAAGRVPDVPHHRQESCATTRAQQEQQVQPGMQSTIPAQVFLMQGKLLEGADLLVIVLCTLPQQCKRNCSPVVSQRHHGPECCKRVTSFLLFPIPTAVATAIDSRVPRGQWNASCSMERLVNAVTREQP